MLVKSPNHYGDRARQTAADAAESAADLSCNWLYFTRASEKLTCQTLALVPSLCCLLRLLLASTFVASAVLLSHTQGYNWGCFSPSAKTQKSFGPDQLAITASLEFHPKDTQS